MMMTDKEILKYIEKHTCNLEYCKKIYDILEGALLEHVLTALRKQIEGESYYVAVQRVAPVNILIKIISKLSKLYAWPVTRTTADPTDQELVDYYVKEGVDLLFLNFNENFNATKRGMIEIFEDYEEGEVGFRALPAYQYLPISYSKVDKTKMSGYVKIMGKGEFQYIDENSFSAFDSQGAKIDSEMADNGGVNPYGIVPAVYVARSNYELIPKDDTDTVPLAILIPLLLTDMNFASMFLSQPILYGMDIEAPENQKISPNHFWNVKSTNLDGKTGTLGVLKAEPNLDAQMKNAIDQLQLWLSTRDIRPGTVSSTATENFSAAISKIIGEMDTIENINAQKSYMLEAESEFWEKLATIHNYLAKEGRIEEKRLFSNPEEFEVNVVYSEPSVIESKTDKVARLKMELDAGLQSKAGALRELYPKESEEEIQARLDEINGEAQFAVPSVKDQMAADQGSGPAPTMDMQTHMDQMHGNGQTQDAKSMGQNMNDMGM